MPVMVVFFALPQALKPTYFPTSIWFPLISMPSTYVSIRVQDTSGNGIGVGVSFLVGVGVGVIRMGGVGVLVGGPVGVGGLVTAGGVKCHHRSTNPSAGQ